MVEACFPWFVTDTNYSFFPHSRSPPLSSPPYHSFREILEQPVLTLEQRHSRAKCLRDFLEVFAKFASVIVREIVEEMDKDESQQKHKYLKV